MAESKKQSVRSMNPWVLHLQKLGLELKCPLCLSLLKQPFLLPCDHIFCNSCLPQSTQSGSECPICKAQYGGRDLRHLPFVENMVTIYKSLDAAFCVNLSQSNSETATVFEQFPASRNADSNNLLYKESFQAAWKDNSSTARSTSSQISNELGQVLLNDSVENRSQKNSVPDDCSLPRESKEYEMADRSGGECCKRRVNFPHASSLTRDGMLQACGSIQKGINQMDQLSPGSPPSFGDNKVSENDSNDRTRDDSRQNYQAARSVKRNSGNRLIQGRHDSSASETEEGHLHKSKRLKMFNCASLNVCFDNVGHIKPGVSEALNCTTPRTDAQPPATLEDLSTIRFICAFCQSSRVSEKTGPILHYINGKSITGKEALTLPNVIHVHTICIEWAPQVYYVGENVKNLKAELGRGAKLKCSKCGLKGAALGCYQKSCRKSYHVPCAMEIPNCRWDYENFLLHCPTHSSMKFPSEKSKSEKHSLKHCSVPTQTAPRQSDFWAGTPDGAKEWVFCGSSLSSEDKCHLIKFGSMIGVPVTKFWRPNVTHVIAATDAKGACTRTLKVLMAILNGRWVLTIEWIKACMESKRPVDEEPYEVSVDNHGSRDGPKTGRLSVLDNGPKLFSGLEFHFVGDFLLGYKEDLQNLVMTAGGRILESEEKAMETNMDIEAPVSTLIVYNLDPPQGCKLGEEVSIIWQRLNEAQDLAAKIGSQVVGHTWLLESIAAYKLQPVVS